MIIGPDLGVEDGRLVTRPEARARTDKSLHGFKKLRAAQPVEAEKRADELIRNTYRTLMSRGMKGCYVYCTDEAVADYLERHLSEEY